MNPRTSDADTPEFNQEAMANAEHPSSDDRDVPENLSKIVVGGGCFWCVEAIFERVKGVYDVRSGYAGGTVASPSYEAVCRGDTGHAEVVQLIYNPDEINLEELLQIHLATHDPTQLNRQGADVGSQYRSVIFYADNDEKATARALLAKLKESGKYTEDIVTTLEPLETFYPAEGYHQDYFERNPNAPYCRAVIEPKIQKFMKHFKDDQK